MAKPEPDPPAEPIRIQFGESEILVRIPEEPKSALDRRLEWLTHPFLMPLITSVLLAAGGTAWAFGGNWIAEREADEKQREKLHIEIQERMRAARDVVEQGGRDHDTSSDEKSYFGNALGRKAVMDSLCWRVVPAGFRARFPEFDQRSTVSLLQELQTVAGQDESDNACEMERLLPVMVKKMGDAHGLDAPALAGRLRYMEQLAALEP